MFDIQLSFIHPPHLHPFIFVCARLLSSCTTFVLVHDLTIGLDTFIINTIVSYRVLISNILSLETHQPDSSQPAEKWLCARILHTNWKTSTCPTFPLDSSSLPFRVTDGKHTGPTRLDGRSVFQYSGNGKREFRLNAPNRNQ